MARTKKTKINLDKDSLREFMQEIYNDCSNMMNSARKELNERKNRAEIDDMEISSFDYTGTGAIESKTYKFDGEVSKTDYTYNTNELLETLNVLRTYGSSPTTLFQRAYGYDPVGNLIDLVDTSESNKFAHFDYDALDRLDIIIDSGYYGGNFDFDYDATGNRLKKQFGATTISYNYFSDSNRLDDDTNFDYDYYANGNLKTKTSKTDSTITEYYYDGENRLTEVEMPDGKTEEYIYDMSGLRAIKKDSQGGITLYVYDMGGNVIMTKQLG